MKKLLVASIAAAAFLSAPALAGPPPSVFNWSGFYAGVNAGSMDFKTSGDFSPVFPAFGWSTDRKEVGVGGIHGGFQGQWGNLVIGAEIAWDAMLGNGFGTTVGGGLGASCGFVAVVETCQARINDILQVGPRVGLAMGQWMVYGTGGWARAEIESRGTVLGAQFSPANNHHDGWYWGGGLEMLVVNGFVIGVEYKHFDLKMEDQTAHTAGDSRRIKADADAVLLRLSIKQ